MVYCVKCGAKNKEDAKYCGKCGATLEPSQEKSFEKRAEAWGEEFGKRAEKWGEDFGKDAENCFGLPHGGAIFGLLIGAVIILVGIALVFREMFALTFDFGVIWPFFVIVFGLLFIAGAVYALTRK